MQDVNKKLLERSITNNKLSHAYLFETDYSDDSLNFVYGFIKSIFTKNLSEKDSAIIKKRIDAESFSEFVVVKRDGQWIKKEQILDLKDKFSVNGQESNIRIYIIYESEKMNESAANTLLKFLEEPEGQIIGILLTNNKHSVLKTLVSRCQVVSLKKDSYVIATENYDLIVDFIYDLITEKMNIYCNIKKYNCLFNTKDDVSESIKNMIIILSDILNNKLFDVYKYIIPNNKINEISNQISTINLTKKINILNDLLEKQKYNLNSSLLLDKLIILMSGVEINDRTN